MKYISQIDKQFSPMIFHIENLAKKGKTSLSLMVEDNDGYNFAFSMNVNDDEHSYQIVERVVKTLLWTVGGSTIYISGSKAIANRLANEYCQKGKREFDFEFVTKVYGKQLEVKYVDNLPKEKRRVIMAGGHNDGCRIGFDAGGSDRKVSAVIDGQVVFSEEVVWFPKINADPGYHFEHIVSAFKQASKYMPRVDAIGVSSAGIYLNNKTAVASLFIATGSDEFEQVQNIYINATNEIGKDIPLEVANDGDVTAIAGAISLKSNNVLGIAMGTSQAGGYVNSQGGLNGWLTELAFVPCDMSPNAEIDEWSGDRGTGVKYFSQDGVIKLAKLSNIELDEDLSPAEKLKIIQQLMSNGDERVKEIYRTIGIYLGYTIPYYSLFYDIKHVLVLGRVLSGEGGDLIVEVAQKILNEEFPHLNITIVTPDENFKRLGQSVVAASMPRISKRK